MCAWYVHGSMCILLHVCSTMACVCMACVCSTMACVFMACVCSTMACVLFLSVTHRSGGRLAAVIMTVYICMCACMHVCMYARRALTCVCSIVTHRLGALCGHDHHSILLDILPACHTGIPNSCIIPNSSRSGHHRTTFRHEFWGRDAVLEIGRGDWRHLGTPVKLFDFCWSVLHSCLCNLRPWFK